MSLNQREILIKDLISYADGDGYQAVELPDNGRTSLRGAGGFAAGTARFAREELRGQRPTANG